MHERTSMARCTNVTKQLEDPNIALNANQFFRIWKDIPNIMLSVNKGIRQQVLPTRIYQQAYNYKINTKCRMCNSQTETTSRILRGCSKIAQSLCKARHDRMLWPIYHRLLQKYNFQDWKTQVNAINTSSYRGKRKHQDSMGHSLSTGECRRKRCQWDRYISRTW